MVPLEDYIEEVVVHDVLDPACICVEIKRNTETVALRMFQPKGADDAAATGPIFFTFYHGEGVIERRLRPDFF
jgi:hypothetical protein